MSNVLRPLPTALETKRFFGADDEDKGVIELIIHGLLPNLSSQIQEKVGRNWVDITNDNGDPAWYHEEIRAGETIRYAYGLNALGRHYRWVIHDKSESHQGGWAASAPFSLSEKSKHIVVTVTL